MRTNEKKGISLIVLVLTIIVMIILASAIILSLSNSGIIGKANKAKQESDTANLKEYVNILQAEYELMTETERAGKTSIEYVNSKLAEKGYKRRLNEDEILLTENAVDAIDAGIQIGDEVKYTVTANKYTPDSSKTGTTNSELTAQTNLKWIYVGVSEKGELLITPDVSTGVPANSKVALYGRQGYLTGPEELNTICDKLYTVTGKGTASSMDMDDVIRILGYTGNKGGYWAYNATTDKTYYVPTTEAMTIGELEKDVGVTLSYRMSPYSDEINDKSYYERYEEDKKLKDYYSNLCYINLLNDGNTLCGVPFDPSKMENPDFVYLIRPSDGDYLLASTCVDANFHSSRVNFSIGYVFTKGVCAENVFGLYESRFCSSLRPVVTLTSRIKKNTTHGSGVWEFVS